MGSLDGDEHLRMAFDTVWMKGQLDWKNFLEDSLNFFPGISGARAFRFARGPLSLHSLAFLSVPSRFETRFFHVLDSSSRVVMFWKECASDAQLQAQKPVPGLFEVFRLSSSGRKNLPQARNSGRRSETSRPEFFFPSKA